MLFHSVIKPVRSSSNKLPTISQAQWDLCHICADEVQYKQTLESQRQESKDSGVPFPPKIFTIRSTSSAVDLEQFFVVTAGLEYQLPTFLRSLDVAFKLTFVLNFKFQESCELFWAFIARYFYKISYTEKSKNNQLLLLQKYLSEQR